MSETSEGEEAQASSSFRSAPAYPHKRTGTVLVCGFGPTLYGDLARVGKLRPGAPKIAVNNASTALKALAIFSQHYDSNKLGVWAKQQHKNFGPECEVHAPGPIDRYDRNKAIYPYVNYFWPQAKGTGTSAWAAAKLARMMGFTEIILCGVPLERGGYADNTFARDFRHPHILKIYRDYIKKDTAWHEGVRSMSGWTKRFFGEPA